MRRGLAQLIAGKQQQTDKLDGRCSRAVYRLPCELDRCCYGFQTERRGLRFGVADVRLEWKIGPAGSGGGGGGGAGGFKSVSHRLAEARSKGCFSTAFSQCLAHSSLSNDGSLPKVIDKDELYILWILLCIFSP